MDDKDLKDAQEPLEKNGVPEELSDEDLDLVSGGGSIHAPVINKQLRQER